MPYRVWISPTFREELLRRYSDLPLKPLLQRVFDRLRSSAADGWEAPFPYAKTLMQVFEIEVDGRVFRVTPLYQIDEQDQAVELFQIGIVALGEAP